MDQRCGTCRYWTEHDQKARLGTCSWWKWNMYPVSGMFHKDMHYNSGTDCPTWLQDKKEVVYATK